MSQQLRAALTCLAEGPNDTMEVVMGTRPTGTADILARMGGAR